jgi:hypothetical protein
VNRILEIKMYETTLKLVLMCRCKTKSVSKKVKFMLNILNKKLPSNETSNLGSDEQNDT